jgi:hypothetical protein
VTFVDISPVKTIAHVGNTQVGLIDYAAMSTTGVKLEVNLATEMQGMELDLKYLVRRSKRHLFLRLIG